MMCRLQNLLYLVDKQIYEEETISECLGTHDSFAFHLTHRPGPDLIPALRRLRVFIYPIIKNWSITQDKNFTGLFRKKIVFLRDLNFPFCRTTKSWNSIF